MIFRIETSGIIKRRAFAARPLHQRLGRDFSSLKSCAWHQSPTGDVSRSRWAMMERFINAIPQGVELKVSQIAEIANMTPKGAGAAIWRAIDAGYDIVRTNPGKMPAKYIKN